MESGSYLLTFALLALILGIGLLASLLIQRERCLRLQKIRR